jgi:hypothetical protein
VAPRHPSIKTRYLNFIRDACEILRGSHPLISEISFMAHALIIEALALYGAFDLIRRFTRH